ncbi:MAG: hypothetical protein WKF75_10610 [Singulisphaera sp.]
MGSGRREIGGGRTACTAVAAVAGPGSGRADGSWRRDLRLKAGGHGGISGPTCMTTRRTPGEEIGQADPREIRGRERVERVGHLAGRAGPVGEEAVEPQAENSLYSFAGSPPYRAM